MTTIPIKINVGRVEFLDSDDDDLVPTLYVSPEDRYRVENNVNRVPISPTDYKLIGYQHVSKEGLEKCTLSQLVTICRMYKLSVFGDEDDLIERIMAFPITSKHSI